MDYGVDALVLEKLVWFELSRWRQSAIVTVVALEDFVLKGQFKAIE